MEEILIAALIGWILTRSLDKKADQPAPESPAAIVPTPGYSQTIGKVYMPWPSALPNRANFNKLFTTDENFIWPGAVCALPTKFQIKTLINNSFIYTDDLARQYSQLSPPDRESRAGDDLQEKLLQQEQIRRQLYNNLVTGCTSYAPGSGGASPAQTISPGRSVAP